MQLRRWQAARQGVTLIELMITLTSLTFVLGSLGSLHLAALRSYAAQAPGGSCRAEADMALRQAAPWIREADEVIEGNSAYLGVRLRRVTDPVDHTSVSSEVWIYPGSDSGYPDVAYGNCVWLARGTGQQAVPCTCLARRSVIGTQGLRFTYILTDGAERTSLLAEDRSRLAAVRMAVTTMQYANGRVYTAHSQTVVALRNYPAEGSSLPGSGSGNPDDVCGPSVAP